MHGDMSLAARREGWLSIQHWLPVRKVLGSGKTSGEGAMDFIFILVGLLVIYGAVSLRVLKQ